MDTRSDRFPLIDSLRAIAALAVVGTHASFFAGAYGTGAALGVYLARLEAGVTLFFLISGFLLYRPFVKARLAGGAAPLTRAYAWRRFLRVGPAYWVALTVIALWLGLAGVFTADGIPTFYAFGQIYREATIGGGLAQAWSLSLEVAFYAFLPLWALAMRRFIPVRDLRNGVRAEIWALVLVVVASFAFKVVLVADTLDSPTRFTPLLVSLPAYMDHFALGMLLAVLSVATEKGLGAGSTLIAVIDRHPWIPWALALAALLVTGALLSAKEFFAGYSGGQVLIRHGLYGCVALGLVLPAVFGSPNRGWVRRLLGWRPLLFLGLVSYGIFLWNLAGLQQLERWGYGDVTLTHPYVDWFVVGAAAAALLGTVSYYVVERPFLLLKRLVGQPAPGVTDGEALAESAPATPVRAG